MYTGVQDKLHLDNGVLRYSVYTRVQDKLHLDAGVLRYRQCVHWGAR